MSKVSVFEENVDFYEEWFDNNNHILNSEIEAIRQVLPDTGEGVEIGAGTGIFSQHLGIKKGIEPSAKMREKARARGINAIAGTAENLPFLDSTYDYALMVTVDCFLDDIIRAFKEVRRIIAPNGHFIIAFIDRDSALGKIYNQNKSSSEFYKYAEFHSSEEIENWLVEAGFQIIDQRQTVFTLENRTQEIRRGVGEGLFAVIKAQKYSSVD